MDKRHWKHGPCPKHDCRKDSCKCGLRLISFPAALGDDSKGSPVAPKNGDYCNALVKYESNGHIYVYSTEGVPERLSSNGTLNFEELLNRPQYNGEVMTGETNIPEVPSAVSQLTNDLGYQTEGEVNSTVASAVASEAAARQQADGTLQSAITRVSNALGAETTARRNADNNLQSQIDGISASSDVKDIVGTYAELQAYDTSTLGNNDIIKVLQDETHSGETTYYRWSTATQTFTLIGEEGPYYTKAAADALLNTKADKATTYTKTEVNATINGVDAKIGTLANLSTTDKSNLVAAVNELASNGRTIVYYTRQLNGGSTYQNFFFSDANRTVPVSASDVYAAYLAGTVLCQEEISTGIFVHAITAASDNHGGDYDFIMSPTWQDGGAKFKIEYNNNALQYYCYGVGIPLLQTTGTSQTEIMSQNAVTSMVFRDPNVRQKIAIGENATTGLNANAYYTAVGASSSATGTSSLALGDSATASGIYSVAFSGSTATNRGEVAFGLGAPNGYNNTNYRLVTGLYDPQSDHDAATKGYVDGSLSGKQDTLTAGSNISISGSTISATDTTYTAGNGLDLTGTVFSVDTDVVATQSDLTNVTSYITDATEYSASATYAVGDYVIHEGAIYQCNIAIVGGEAWNASHWDAVPSLQDQLDNTETWTFELEGGTTVTKKMVVR